MDYYEVLGLDKEDKPSADDVKRAYRKKARLTHPDVSGDTEEFAKVQEAYDTLRDPEKRSYYDATGSAKDELKDRPELEIILQVFSDIMRKDVPLHVNYIDMMKEIITSTLEDVSKKREEIEIAKKRYAKVMKKIKGKDKDKSLFKNMLLFAIQKNDIKMISLNGLCVNLEAAIRVLANFEFETDPKPNEERYEREEATSFEELSELFKRFSNKGRWGD